MVLGCSLTVRHSNWTSFYSVTSFDVTPRMSWYCLFAKTLSRYISICGFQGTCAMQPEACTITWKTVLKACFHKQFFIWLYRRETLWLRKALAFRSALRNGTALTEVYQSFESLMNSSLQITGKNQLYKTALPCWIRLTHSLTQVSLFPPPIGTCPFYIKHFFKWFF